MEDAPRILIVDDSSENIRLLAGMLQPEGYTVIASRSGEDALQTIAQRLPDLVLLDVVMPGLSGFEVCARLREEEGTRLLPVILVTGVRQEERVQGLEVGADDFLAKPVNREELLARVRSLLRVGGLHAKIREQAEQLAKWNLTLEQRVQEQLQEIDRISQLKHFFSPQVSEAILQNGEAALAVPQRRDICVVFVDLRGFTEFSAVSEPEELIAVLRAYHEAVGRAVNTHGGTVERFAGDGVMLYFNAPLEQDEPELRAIRTALEIRDGVGALCEGWKRKRHKLGVGIGMASGFATVGTVGFEGRLDYAAIGTVTNLAARLCDEAEDRQILLSQRLSARLDGQVRCAPAGVFDVKGIPRPVQVFALESLAVDGDAGSGAS